MVSVIFTGPETVPPVEGIIQRDIYRVIHKPQLGISLLSISNFAAYSTRCLNDNPFATLDHWVFFRPSCLCIPLQLNSRIHPAYFLDYRWNKLHSPAHEDIAILGISGRRRSGRAAAVPVPIARAHPHNQAAPTIMAPTSVVVGASGELWAPLWWEPPPLGDRLGHPSLAH